MRLPLLFRTLRARPGLGLLSLALALLLGLAMPSDAEAARPKKGKRAQASSVQQRRGRTAARAAVTRGRRAKADRRARRGRRSRVVLAPIVPQVEKAVVVSDSAPVLRDSIVSLARQQIGTPYILGAQTPGRAFDCSGLVRYVMGWLNVRLPRTANEQAYTGIRVGRELDRMKPGDLLTFGNGRRITHIAIYSGNGRYVHASRPGVGVVESVLNHRASRFKGAIRLVADASDTTTATP